MFILLLFSNVFAQDCREYHSSCKYYSCEENNRNCGDSGYLIGFGKKYCEKFQENERSFSPQGKSWLQDVRKCLIEEIDTLGSSLTCVELKNKALNQHIDCYEKTNFCSLKLSDRLKLYRIIIKDFWRYEILRTGMAVRLRCFLPDQTFI